MQKILKIWDVDADNTVISKFIETNNNSKYLIRYFDNVIRPLVLILPKMSGYDKNSNGKDEEKDKNSNNKLKHRQ